MQNPNSAALYAHALSRSFETRTRADGSIFVCLADNAPAWMTDAIHAAHGDMLPNDWAYRACERAADYLADTDADEWEDNSHEFADGATDCYNGRLLDWAASHLDRASYCDEAIDEGLCDPSKGLFHILQCGQYRELESIYSALVSAIESHADDNPCAWVAGSNMPGYMPDDVLAGFDTFEDACASIAEDMERDADALADAAPKKPYDAAELRDAAELNERARELRDAAEKLREYSDSDAHEWGAKIAGRHYFVSHGEAR